MTSTLQALPHPTPTGPGQLLASDDERERTASRLRDAAAVGRLTLAEADERQALAYAARTRDDLAPLVADLPEPPPEAQRIGPLPERSRRRLAVHAAVVAVLAVVLVTGWALGPQLFFWPAWPLFWLVVSVVVHHRRARRAAEQTA